MERDKPGPTTPHGPEPAVGPHEVVVTELDRRFLRGLFSEQHSWTSDEPAAYGGTGRGPTPYDLLLMSLGACCTSPRTAPSTAPSRASWRSGRG